MKCIACNREVECNKDKIECKNFYYIHSEITCFCKQCRIHLSIKSPYPLEDKEYFEQISKCYNLTVKEKIRLLSSRKN